MSPGDLGAVSGEPVELVLFDRGVPGATAIEVLGLVRPPPGAEVAPALFLSDGGGVAVSAPGEIRLDAGASDAAIAAAVDQLVGSTPRPEPRLMPPIEEIDVGQIVGSRPGVITYQRRRSGLGVLAPLAALALLLGAIAGYSWFAAARPAPSPSPSPSPTAPAEPTAVVDLAAQVVEPTAVPTATPLPVGGPVAEDSGAPPPRPRGAFPPARPGADEGSALALPPGAPPLDPGASAAPSPVVETGLEGRVTDASTGAGLPGAVVAYRGPASGQVTTGGDGRYRVPDLPPGAYEVVAVAPGYAQTRNKAGIVADTLTTDNLSLSPMAGASVAPFLTVTDQRSGQPVAAYGYPVRPGDTLRAIAERAGATVDELLALNAIDDPDHLAPGRVIYLPASTFGQK